MSNDLKSNLALVLAITRGIVRDQRMRRRVLSTVLGAALAMVAVGAFVIDGWLQGSILLFLLYWLACGWLTVLALLMAVFEILMVKAASRAELRKAREACRAPESGRRDRDGTT